MYRNVLLVLFIFISCQIILASLGGKTYAGASDRLYLGLIEGEESLDKLNWSTVPAGMMLSFHPNEKVGKWQVSCNNHFGLPRVLKGSFSYTLEKGSGLIIFLNKGDVVSKGVMKGGKTEITSAGMLEKIWEKLEGTHETLATLWLTDEMFGSGDISFTERQWIFLLAEEQLDRQLNQL